MYPQVVRALFAGRLVPVLGPLASPSVPPPPEPAAAAAHLAAVFAYPAAGREGSLTRVSHYVAVTHGVGPLYDELRNLYGGEYEPGPVHRALAALPAQLRARGLPLQMSSRRATTERSSGRSPRPARRSTSSPTSRSVVTGGSSSMWRLTARPTWSRSRTSRSGSRRRSARSCSRSTAAPTTSPEPSATATSSVRTTTSTTWWRRG